MSTLLAFVSTGLKADQLDRPTTNNDLFFSYAQVRGHLEHGWYLHNPDLGWPYGQDMRLFPVLDQTHFALLKVVGLFSRDPILVTNAYYLIGFPLAGAFAYLFLRVVGVWRWLAVPFAVSYAILPWHSDRAVHLFLASYWVVPLGLTMVFVVGTGRWDDLLARLPALRRRLLTCLGVVGAIAVGLGGVYYAMMLGALVLIAVGLRGRKAWRGPSAWLAGPLAGSVLASLVLAQSAYNQARGPQDVGGAFTRYPGESEVYGGRLANLLLPWHGTPLLGRLRDGYDQDTLIDNPTTQHGLIAVAGTWLLLALVVRLVLVHRRPAPGSALPWLAGLNLVLVFAFVSTGLGSLVAQVFPQLRGWDRYSIFVALLGTAAAALGVQHLVKRAPPPRRFLALVLAVVLTSVVVLGDEAKSELDLGSRALADKLAAARTSLLAVDRAVGSDDCPVMQYPAISYPEAGLVGNVGDYDELIGYLAGSDHRLSYGAVKGSLAGDWTRGLDDRTASAFALQVAAAGFCAVEVLDGAVTSGRERALVAGLPAALGPAITVDTVNERTWFGLRRATDRFRALTPAQQATVRQAALRPPQLALDPDQASSPRGGTDEYRFLTANHGTLLLTNPSGTARRVTATVRLANPYAEAIDQVRVADQLVGVGKDTVAVTFMREVAPHSTLRLALSTTSKGAQGLGTRVFLAVYDPVVDFDRGPITG